MLGEEPNTETFQISFGVQGGNQCLFLFHIFLDDTLRIYKGGFEERGAD